MGRQRHTTEQIISKLREVEVLQAKGMSMGEAESWYRKAIQAAPRREDLWIELGNLYEEWKEYPKALQSYGTATKIGPRGYYFAGLEQGRVLRKMKQPKDAIAVLNAVLEKAPGMSDASFELAIIYFQLGNLDKAKLFAKTVFENVKRYPSSLDRQMADSLKSMGVQPPQ